MIFWKTKLILLLKKRVWYWLCKKLIFLAGSRSLLRLPVGSEQAFFSLFTWISTNLRRLQKYHLFLGTNITFFLKNITFFFEKYHLFFEKYHFFLKNITFFLKNITFFQKNITFFWKISLFFRKNQKTAKSTRKQLKALENS